MNRLFALVSCGLLFSVSALPAAAQPGGPCSLISDAALSQVLGSPAHVLSLMSNPIAASAGTMGVADMCYAQLGGQNVVMITHMVGLPTPGDANGVLAMTQGGPTSVGSGGGQLDPSKLTTTPISGLGDAAMLLTGGSANQQYAN